MNGSGHCGHSCGGHGMPPSNTLFVLRSGTVLLTFVSVFMMGFALDHLHHSTGPFIYFIATNALVFCYSVAALAKSCYGSTCWLVTMADVVVVVVLLTSFGAACAVIFAISRFALLVSIAIAMTLLSSVVYLLLFACGIIAMHRSESA